MHAAILRSRPDLTGLPYTVMAEGWDSTAIDVDDRIIFKFPREAEAGDALRREASILAALDGRMNLPIPRMTLHEGPPLFSSHHKLKGRHLLSADYETLLESAKARLGEDLGRFYAELHGVEQAVMTAAGAEAVEAWQSAERMESQAAKLPGAFRPAAVALLQDYQALPPDPHGEVFGFFDGHGWNMAFDHDKNRLNGIYDFADSGFGPLHQDFIYSSFISPDLTKRIAASYESRTGRRLDRRRIDILTGVHRLSEFAEYADDPAHAPEMIRYFRLWSDASPARR